MILRRKSRYVLVEVSCKADLNSSEIKKDVMLSLTKELGGLGRLRAGPKIVWCDSDSRFIVRVNRGYEKAVVLAFAFIKKLGGVRAGFYTLGVSGSIRSLIESCRVV